MRLSTNEQRFSHLCIRDVSWHPEIPVIVGTGWNGYSHSNGCILRYTHLGSSRQDSSSSQMTMDLDPDSEGIEESQDMNWGEEGSTDDSEWEVHFGNE